MTTLRSIGALSLALAASWPVAAADAPQRVPVAFPPARAQLTLIAGANANAALSEHQPPTVDAKSPAEQALRQDCANGESQRAETSKGFLLGFALQSWHVLLHPLAVAVQEELHKYAQVSAASTSGDYYRASDPAASAAPLASRISCVRFTRFGATDATADQVVLDFVASVRLDAPRDAIRLRPLRLFISQGGAKSTDGHYSVAIAIKANAVWRDEYAGHQGLVFEQTVATESVDLKSGSFLKYYPSDPESGSRVPIVPVSFGLDRSRDFGRAEFSVSVAELGTAPATLKLLADMLPDPNEDLCKLLIAAAAAGAGLP
jgi:hypothetical protein